MQVSNYFCYSGYTLFVESAVYMMQISHIKNGI